MNIGKKYKHAPDPIPDLTPLLLTVDFLTENGSVIAGDAVIITVDGPSLQFGTEVAFCTSLRNAVRYYPGKIYFFSPVFKS